jgi:hypothetical protein
MRHRAATGILAALALIAPTHLLGDDVSGKDHLLCTVIEATQCTPDAECRTDDLGELNIPQFLEIDLKAKTVSTTKASGQGRSSPIGNLVRDGGLIVLQGLENGRAFSFEIDEHNGMASMAVARDGSTVSAFGVCTPLPDAR